MYWPNVSVSFIYSSSFMWAHKCIPSKLHSNILLRLSPKSKWTAVAEMIANKKCLQYHLTSAFQMKSCWKLDSSIEGVNVVLYNKSDKSLVHNLIMATNRIILIFLNTFIWLLSVFGLCVRDFFVCCRRIELSEISLVKRL